MEEKEEGSFTEKINDEAAIAEPSRRRTLEVRFSIRQQETEPFAGEEFAGIGI